ncbi:phospho-sugar mutase [Aquimarina agarivorans]|uniref:phospho-sugar mutase n=1 Tax=Aquimarina agarivorans TaxID=980584 RepID=UPI000248E8B8|nr:phospho-sugar mutase [Aquimarina agarivorans]
MNTLTSTIQERVNEWLSPTFDTATQNEINELLKTNPAEIEDSFYKDLEFGTGGMRGVMGAGTNRINKYTLGKSTQGLSNYLKKQFAGQEIKTVIAYDCRNNSDTLARTVAEVFAANGIKVHLFSSLRTTPELSFAVKYLNCHCGIVLTASHNPPEYNGYKVYWQDGGQIVPPEDAEIVSTINSLSYNDIKFDADKNLIEIIDEEVDQPFIDACVANGSIIASQAAKDDLTIVFTSLHGTSIKSIPQTLAQAGFKNVHIVEEQAEPNGNFPTVKSPNPEETEALEMATQLANKVGADILIGTDPDCDRLGIAVRDSNNKMKLLNGNQTMVVMIGFLLDQYKNEKGLKGNEFIASTIVSTPMLRTIANAYNVEYKEVLTGFKWIAKLVKDFPELNFIGGGEESYGFMVGDFVRDKDAVTSTLLACEIAAYAKANGNSFLNLLEDLYKKHGFFKEHLVSLVKKGISGAEEIKQKMIDLRQNPLKEINGSQVVFIEDYLSGEAINLQDNSTLKIDLPKANVLIYYTEDGSKIAARPSGTEPKIKFYISVQSAVNDNDSLSEIETNLDAKIQQTLEELGLK